MGRSCNAAGRLPGWENAVNAGRRCHRDGSGRPPRTVSRATIAGAGAWPIGQAMDASHDGSHFGSAHRGSGVTSSPAHGVSGVLDCGLRPILQPSDEIGRRMTGLEPREHMHSIGERTHAERFRVEAPTESDEVSFDHISRAARDQRDAAQRWPHEMTVEAVRRPAGTCVDGVHEGTVGSALIRCSSGVRRSWNGPVSSPSGSSRTAYGGLHDR